jgi:hypothetical protein
VAVLGVFLGLVLGLAAGGRLENLLDVRLRWLPVLLVAAAARFGLDAALATGGVPETLRLWLVLVTYFYLTAMLLANRSLPGMVAAALGTVANGIAIVVNGGWMPVWQPSLAAAGFDSTAVHSSFHVLLTGPVDAGFFAHGGPLADVIPIPIPIIASVASVGWRSSCSPPSSGRRCWFRCLCRPSCRRDRGRCGTRTSGWPPTARSRPCGWRRS